MGKFRNNPFLKNVAMVAGGTAAAQGIAILTSPIVTRLYSPADFGVFAVFGAVLGILGQLSTLRYSVTIPLAENEDLAENITKLSLLIALTLSALLALNLLLFRDYFLTRFSMSHAAPYLWLLPVCLFGVGVYEALSGWAVRKKNFKVIARTKIAQGTSSSGIKLGLGWFGIKPAGLLLGLLASEIAGSGTLMRGLLREKPHFFNSISWRGIGDAARRFSRFPLLQSWSRLLLSLAFNLPAILIGVFYGAEPAGLFGLANNMVNMPMNLLGTSVAQVYYAEIAGYGKSQPGMIRRLSISIMKKMLLIGIIPTGAMVIAGPWIFSFIFGAKWHDAGVYGRFLALLILSRFLATPIMTCLDVLERQLTQFIINTVRVGSISSIFLICQEFNIRIKDTVFIYSICLFLFYLVVIGIVIITLFKMENKQRQLCKVFQ